MSVEPKGGVARVVPVRELARDVRSAQVGQVMDYSPSGLFVSLRPVGGGKEWTASVDEIEAWEPGERDGS